MVSIAKVRRTGLEWALLVGTAAFILVCISSYTTYLFWNDERVSFMLTMTYFVSGFFIIAKLFEEIFERKTQTKKARKEYTTHIIKWLIIGALFWIGGEAYYYYLMDGSDFRFITMTALGFGIFAIAALIAENALQNRIDPIYVRDE